MMKEKSRSCKIRAKRAIGARMATRPTPRKFKMPDVMARLQQTFGDSCYESSDIARGLELNDTPLLQ
jgi:hypothetical protein